MNSLLNPLPEMESFNKLLNAVSNNITPILATGVLNSQKSHLIYGIIDSLDAPALVVAENEIKAKEIFEDLSFFYKNNVILYPSKDIIFYSADIKSTDIIKKRFEVIDKILFGSDNKLIIVLSIEALFDKLVPKSRFVDFIIKIKEGMLISIDTLCQKLIFMGYERCDLVESQGQFAVRGGIVDIFSPVSDSAVRIEFWGDEVDTIRILDEYSQRSIEKIPSITLYPTRELVFEQKELDFAILKIKKEFNSLLNSFEKKSMLSEYENLKEYIGEAIENLEEQKNISGIDKYIGFFYDNCETILDYISDNTIIFYDEPNRIREHSERIFDEFSQSIKSRIEKGYMLPSNADMIFSYNDILFKCSKFREIIFSGLVKNIKDFSLKATYDFLIKSSGTFKNNFQLLIDDLKYLTSNDYRIMFFAGNKIRCERIVKELNSNDITSFFSENPKMLDMSKNVIYVIRGSLNSGFEYVNEKFVVISDKEIFGVEKKKRKKKKNKNSIKIQNFSDLKQGDYVVHDNHGIGIFKGIEKITSDGITKDYMKIGYADDGNLYVAINQMDMVQKYIGGEAHVPKLNKLGGTQWTKAKAKAKKAASILAKDLVELYAKRQSAKGFVYSSDTVWQKEFEDSFPFQETDDQLNAVEDVKLDMEKGKVMDRLICGDVGFGKTEIALRAAFKTVMDSRQVAYLVPTTILAQQHFNTFLGRMRNFPIKIEMMSRFRTPKQQKEVINGLKNGSVDIVVGTHRILSKDLEFKNLGLIIVDEEQRFGVAHKDKMKSLKQDVNVLTLTATPIPRTLHMSLTGIRDMSILEEPPGERLPIQTYVMEYNDESVKDAIHRELARGGQVYYLYNRVKNISEITLKIQRLVPEANVSFAHGQMSERELENIMIEFMQGNIDVLICTTIIETGLDIPNVNTIIIQDADRMGLSQLYQLRGRVGRSNRSSFAYLMYKKDKVLKEVSEKRLQTIKEFTEFGSGFKVAMRDLEIRGAGNLLGAEQHGHMDSVGYDMYCKLLDQAVHEINGESVKEDFETLIDLNINAYIPESYISNEEQKLEMYKRISEIQNQNDFFDVQDELEDRFGQIPGCVQNLLDIAAMKSAAHKIGIISIIQKRQNIILKFKDNSDIDIPKLIEAVKNNSEKLMLSGGESPYLTYKTFEKDVKFIPDLRKCLEEII